MCLCIECAVEYDEAQMTDVGSKCVQSSEAGRLSPAGLIKQDVLKELASRVRLISSYSVSYEPDAVRFGQHKSVRDKVPKLSEEWARSRVRGRGRWPHVLSILLGNFLYVVSWMQSRHYPSNV